MRFILVDEFKNLEAGVSVEAIKRIATDEEYFKDHLPGFPIVPGVLLVEMMAQSIGMCLEAENPSKGTPVLSLIDKAKFKSPVKPGDEVRIYGRVLSSTEDFAKTRCRAEVMGEVVSSADLFFHFTLSTAIESNILQGIFEQYAKKQVNQ